MKPTSANNVASHFAFYRQTDPAEPELTIDPRVRVDRVIQGVGGTSTASLELQWLGHPVADSDTPEMEELSETEITNLYGPTVRCAVGLVPAAGGTKADIEFLAHGYLDAPGIQFGSSTDKAFFKRTLLLRSIVKRSLRTENAIIHGRYMLSRATAEYLDENPPADPSVPLQIPWSTVATRVTALPAIFNAGGKPNRRKQPIRFDATGCWGFNPIHLFTYDDDPNAEYWTYLQALRYLVMVYLPFGMDAAVGPGNLFMAEREGSASPYWWEEAETDVSTPLTVFKRLAGTHGP